jgi:excisionase family DNA binding protein
MFYTRKETADQLKISLSTLDKLINAGQITCFKVGGQKRISEQSIKDFLEANVLRFDLKPKAEIIRPVIRQ